MASNPSDSDITAALVRTKAEQQRASEAFTKEIEQLKAIDAKKKEDSQTLASITTELMRKLAEAARKKEAARGREAALKDKEASEMELSTLREGFRAVQLENDALKQKLSNLQNILESRAQAQSFLDNRSTENKYLSEEELLGDEEDPEADAALERSLARININTDVSLIEETDRNNKNLEVDAAKTKRRLEFSKDEDTVSPSDKEADDLDLSKSSISVMISPNTPITTQPLRHGDPVFNFSPFPDSLLPSHQSTPSFKNPSESNSPLFSSSTRPPNFNLHPTTLQPLRHGDPVFNFSPLPDSLLPNRQSIPSFKNPSESNSPLFPSSTRPPGLGLLFATLSPPVRSSSTTNLSSVARAERLSSTTPHPPQRYITLSPITPKKPQKQIIDEAIATALAEQQLKFTQQLQNVRQSMTAEIEKATARADEAMAERDAALIAQKDAEAREKIALDAKAIIELESARAKAEKAAVDPAVTQANNEKTAAAATQEQLAVQKANADRATADAARLAAEAQAKTEHDARIAADRAAQAQLAAQQTIINKATADRIAAETARLIAERKTEAERQKAEAQARAAQRNQMWAALKAQLKSDAAQITANKISADKEAAEAREKIAQEAKAAAELEANLAEARRIAAETARLEAEAKERAERTASEQRVLDARAEAEKRVAEIALTALKTQADFNTQHEEANEARQFKKLSGWFNCS